jgi:uncharacterized protein YbbC (DUF1343 family)/CubicO group peptidase (beta-lactamase class C family)
MKQANLFPSIVTLFSALVLVGIWAADAQAKPPEKISWEAAEMDADLAAKIDQAVKRSMDEGNMAGCVVLIGRRGGIVLEKAYGYRSMEPDEEEMTIDTVFDMASLTKPVATATSIMILAERGKLKLDDKVAKYIEGFDKNGKGDITIEQLLVHSSGLIPDNPLGDYEKGWGSAATKINDLKLLSEPGTAFKYSDVNFILLGKIVEKVAGKPLEQFAKEEVYAKLGMNESGYLPSEALRKRSASTEKMPDADRWFKGEVHDPRASKMGGVAGHAGLFSTAHDLAIYATMMLQDGEYDGVRVLAAETVDDMTTARQVGNNKRSLGWDKRSAYSRNRGRSMSDRAFGHGGFTGTAMWIDPDRDLYVIFLSNRLHPDGKGEVNSLAGRIGAYACAAIVRPCPDCGETEEVAGDDEREQDVRLASTSKPASTSSKANEIEGATRLGIDVLKSDGFKLLEGKRVGLVTNHTGVDSTGKSTIDLLHEAENVKLVALFSPEHGIRGELDVSDIGDTVDEKTGVYVHSLYGKSRKPSKEQMDKLDVLVFDIQDIGARFYTYTSTMGLCMEAAAENGKKFIVLDRPNPIGGEIVEGPMLDRGGESFVAHHQLPIRHGMTIGELAHMFKEERKLEVDMTVVEMKSWKRSMYLFDTGLSWKNPSPNMRSLRAAALYPGVGMMEFTNISVGRGTETPFELMGAPWIRERELAYEVNKAMPPGVRVLPMRFTPTSSKFPKEECGGLSFVITDWNAFRSFDLGLTIATALRKLQPEEWESKRWLRLLGNQDVYDRVMKGDDVAEILADVDADLAKFRERKKKYELYE